MRILIASIALCLTAGCASTSGATQTTSGKPAEPVVEKMAVVNNSKFDLASCGLKPIESAVNDTILTAAMLLARPAFGECLMDPKSRGAEADTQVMIKATASDTEVKFDVSSPNLQPSGKACIEKVLTSLALKPLPKGAKPVEAARPFAFSSAQGVKFGVNEASDVVGHIRVAQAGWCDCFASLGNTPPPTILAALRVTADKPVEVMMKAKEADQPVASCLESKIKALAPKTEREITVTHQFLLINGLAAQETADVVPTLQFHQLDAIAQGGEVNVAMNAGKIDLAWADYQDSARRYNAKPGTALMKELRDRCATLLVGDEGLRGSLDSLKTTYERTQKVIATLKPTDPVWSQIETSVNDTLTNTAKQLAASVEQKKAHAAICQKLK